MIQGDSDDGCPSTNPKLFLSHCAATAAVHYQVAICGHCQPRRLIAIRPQKMAANDTRFGGNQIKNPSTSAAPRIILKQPA
jgi:hypothetical protein